MISGKTAIKVVSIIIVIGLVIRVLGFVRELIIANYYGAGSAMDAFNIANNIPLLAGLGLAITTTHLDPNDQQWHHHCR